MDNHIRKISAGWEAERRYSVAERGLPPPSLGMVPSTSEDLHAWSIYRQNLNSDFTDSALGSSEKSPLPYGNFQLRESTVQSILNHPRYGPKSALGGNMYTYLKFGLPRVFPPQRGKDSSHSSDDGTRRHRARSEADLLNLHYSPGTRTRGKSISQANLLSPDLLMRREQASQRRSLHDLRSPRPASLAVPPGHHVAHHLHHLHHHHHAHARPPSALSDPVPEPFSFSMLHPQQYTGIYPHIHVRNLTARSNRGETLVSSLSLEVKAGEILAIMSTASATSTALLDCIAGKKRYSGQISLNGQPVNSRELRNRVAHVKANAVLPQDLPVHNCLRYYALLCGPPESRGKLPTSERVRIVTEELGLSPVLDTKVGHLTKSEVSRLLVAVALLTDAQILAVDHITDAMDIFDTFFLVEFLRQWASGATGGVSGRIVVMVLQPPTYEILTMVSRLVMLSGPEVMYEGPSRLLQEYFASAEYPCPAFKNPADYYLDLVTLDDLSTEAMLESSQRVERLSSLYKRRHQPPHLPQPYSPPAKFSKAGIIGQAWALLAASTVYSQPAAFCRWVSRVLAAALASLAIGAIFWDIPSSDPTLSRDDRLGYHFAVMAVGSLPLAVSMGEAKVHSPHADSDIAAGLYSRPLFLITQLIYSLIPSCLVWLAYLVPAYCMSGLYDEYNPDAFTNYIGYSLAVLLALEYTVTFISVVTLGNRSATILLTVLIAWLLGSSQCGWPLAERVAGGLAKVVSPFPSAYPALLSPDHSPAVLQRLSSRLVCRNKQVQHQDIIVHLPCPVPNGTAALMRRGIPVNPVDPAPTSLSILGVVSIAAIVVFSLEQLWRRPAR